MRENDTDNVSVQVCRALLAQGLGECNEYCLNKWDDRKTKRALVLFVGDISGAMFGTATT